MRLLTTALTFACALGTARAQLDEAQPSCAPLVYVLKVQPGSSSKMQVSAALNGGKPIRIDSAKSTDSAKADVSAQIKGAGNVLSVQWAVTGDANKPDARLTWVSLQVGSGQRYTPVAVFRTDYYAGRKSLNFKFDAPPKNSLRCDPKAAQYGVTLGQAVGDGRVAQFTLSVNGKFYAITNNEPSDMMRGLRLDLRPYLVRGKNDVKLGWQVLKEQSASDAYGAQITRTQGGKTDVLAKTVVKGKQGEVGQLLTSITVP